LDLKHLTQSAERGITALLMNKVHSDLESSKHIDDEDEHTVDTSDEVVTRRSCVCLCCSCFLLQTFTTVILSFLFTSPSLVLTSLDVVGIEALPCLSESDSVNVTFNVTFDLWNSNIIEGSLDTALISIRSIDRFEHDFPSAAILLATAPLVDRGTIVSPGRNTFHRLVSIHVSEVSDVSLIQRILLDCSQHASSKNTLLRADIRDLELRFLGATAKGKTASLETSFNCPNQHSIGCG
jgi:hypothetical protein